MFLFKTKKPYFLSIITFCVGSLLSQSTVALAQLRLGRGIEPGLEGHIIEYQIQQQPLSKMRGVSGCSTGIGTGCNKTASLLQKLVTESSQKSYQDILLQAAGGKENYSVFATYYPQNVNIDYMPLNSFWVDGGEYVLDSHKYSGISNLNKVAPLELALAVKQFQYAPIANTQQNLNLQQGLIALKTAYGKTLIEEALKIPNIEQKIAASGLSIEETNFHLQQFINSVEAIQSGDRYQINRSLYNILSNPYTSEPAVLNRPLLGITDSFEEYIGIGLRANEYIASTVAGEYSETFIGFPEVTMVADSNSQSGNTVNTYLYVAMGLGGLTLLALLLDSSEGTESNLAALSANNLSNLENNGSDNSQNDSDNTTEEKPNFSPQIIETPVLKSPTETTSTIPEHSSILQFIVLMVLSRLFLRHNY